MRTSLKGAMPRLTIAMLLAVLPLSSCGLFVKMLGVPTDCERLAAELDFAISDRIVRGGWHGSVADFPVSGDARSLTLDLVASRVDASHYEIEGTFELEGEAPAEIHGTVSGGCDERYLVVAASVEGPSTEPGLSPESLPPPARLDAEVRDATGTTLWHVTASSGMLPQGDHENDTLLLEIESAADDTVAGQATLERTQAP